MAFYLKYRPGQIKDLDLVEVREGLLKVLSKKQIPHALLFSGPRGAGKTSAARIVAKSLNCLKNDGRGEPCAKCEVCESIAGGDFIDLIEIDGASNRRIDDIRDLKENIKLVPASGRVKVYIIDEVHMLTNEAFNALLKTLEEPPAKAFFILCTTEKDKLPETIISRCIEFAFRKAKPEEVKASLNKVIKGEKIKIDKKALDLLAQSVDGSFRDAQKILDQLVVGDEPIELAQVQGALGQSTGFSEEELLVLLVGETPQPALEKMEQLAQDGTDFERFSTRFLDLLRRVLLAKVGVGEMKLTQAVEALTVREIKQLVGLFSLATKEMKGSVIERLPLEMAIVEWFERRGFLPQPTPSTPRQQQGQSTPKATQSGGQVDGQAAPAPQKQTSSPAPTPPAKPKVAPVKPAPAPEKPRQQQGQSTPKATQSGGQVDGQAAKIEAAPPKAVVPPQASQAGGQANGKLDLNSIQTNWDALLTQVKPMNHSLSALLKACRPQSVEGETLILEVFYRFHKERLEAAKCRDLVEEAVAAVYGQPLKIKCVLGEKEMTVAPVASSLDNEVVSQAQEMFGATEGGVAH